MKSLFYFIPIVFLTMVCVVGLQAQLETVGGPYTPDTNTVVLLHFDGNMTNAAAALGKTDTAAKRHTTNPARSTSSTIPALPAWASACASTTAPSPTRRI